MKWFMIDKDDKIIPLEEATFENTKGDISGEKALKIAKKNNLRLPYIFEVIEKMKEKNCLLDVLKQGWILTGERYKNQLSRLDLDGYLGLCLGWYFLSSSLSDGRVVLVKD